MRYNATTQECVTAYRRYDPATGQWLSQDPIRFASKTTNLSAYCGNNPVNKSDPLGLDDFDDGGFDFGDDGDLSGDDFGDETYGRDQGVQGESGEGTIVTGNSVLTEQEATDVSSDFPATGQEGDEIHPDPSANPDLSLTAAQPAIIVSTLPSEPIDEEEGYDEPASAPGPSPYGPPLLSCPKYSAPGMEGEPPQVFPGGPSGLPKTVNGAEVVWSSDPNGNLVPLLRGGLADLPNPPAAGAYTGSTPGPIENNEPGADFSGDSSGDFGGGADFGDDTASTPSNPSLVGEGGVRHRRGRRRPNCERGCSTREWRNTFEHRASIMELRRGTATPRSRVHCRRRHIYRWNCGKRDQLGRKRGG
jgi:RHS repeat-associated protein